MTFRRLIGFLAALLCCLPLAAQYRDDQFKRDAFTQTYADTSQKTKSDTTQIFNFKEFFGGIAHKRTASLKTLSIGSAVLVGGNQIYHKQYWKLPIIYGGIGAGIYGGIRFGQLYKDTGESRYQTYSTLAYVGAGLCYWGSLLDGAIQFDKGGKWPNPAKATAYSLLLPGLGQIYNGEAWKVPLYLGVLAGSVHFYVENNVQYQRWKSIHNQATADGVEERPPISGDTAKHYRDVYRRYRDYSILAIALTYVIQVVDANVFAYMQDFEMSDDISMKVAPSVISTEFASAPAVGVSFGLRF